PTGTVGENDRHFGESESVFPGEEFRFDLKGVAYKLDMLKRYRLQYAASVTHEPGRCIFDGHSRDHPHIGTCKIRKQDATDRPVHNIDARSVTRPNRQIRAVNSACFVKTNQIFRIMREVRVHLEYIVVVMADSIVKSNDIRCAKTLFS